MVVVPVISRSLVVGRRVGAVAGVVADLVVPRGMPRRRLAASLVLQVGGVAAGVGVVGAVVVGLVSGLVVGDDGRLPVLRRRLRPVAVAVVPSAAAVVVPPAAAEARAELQAHSSLVASSEVADSAPGASSNYSSWELGATGSGKQHYPGSSCWGYLCSGGVDGSETDSVGVVGDIYSGWRD